MKKYNLNLLFAVATLMLGACQSPVKVEEPVNEVENNVEQDSSEVEKSRLVKITYYDKSVFKLPLDHPYWSTTVLSNDTIEKLKKHYGFTDEEIAIDDEVIAEEDSVSSEKVTEKFDSEEVKTTDNETSSIVSTSTPNTSSNATSTKPNTSNSTTNNSSDVTKPNNNPSSNSSTTNKPITPPVVEQPSEPAPQPPVVEETKKPVDLLDWNHIKSTLIAKGENLGMSLDTSLTRENQGYASPWQSSYMPVTNEDVIGYIGVQMEQCASHGWEFFNLEWVPQGDGNVNIYLIR